MRLRLLSMLIIAVCSVPVYSVETTTSATSSKPPAYRYIYKNDSLKNVLATYARDSGFTLLLSPLLTTTQLATTVSGGFSVASPADLLDIFASQYGFNWFVYSGKLYITSSNVVTKSVSVAAENMVNVKNSLVQSGLYLNKFGYSELSYENKIVISGPQEYVDLVLAQINSLDIQGSAQEFAIFRLKYANADDLTLNFNNQQVVVPGVATVLKGLVQNSGSGVASSSKVALSSNITQGIQNNSGNTNSNGTDSNNSDSGNAQVSNTVIQADRRLNAVVIRDKGPNLPIYKKLIAELDQPTPLVRIDVLVVRLDQTLLSQAGINWWASIAGVGGVGFGGSNLSSQMQNGGTNNLATSFGASSGQLSAGSLTSIAASLQTLENQKMSKTMARPSLATTDNIPASVSIVENSYINAIQNVAANTATSQNLANNIQVIQGLQITPHVIYDGDKVKIKVAMILQDGSFNNLTTNPSPNTAQSSINSQAVVAEGKSIILAGYTRDSIEDTSTKVPLLGDIPLLGWFFKSTANEKHSMTTVYIITPEIISNDGADLNNLMLKGKKVKLPKNSVQLGE